MRRALFISVALALVAALIAGCGGGSRHSSSTVSGTSSTTQTAAPSPAPAPSGGGTATGPAKAVPVPVQRPSASAIARACPAGKARMGCSVQAIPNLRRGRVAAPAGLLFPDVSVWQRNVGWDAVAGWQRAHGWHPMAIWKMGEYRVDPYARQNAAETARLGFWRAGYWFERNTGCAAEATQMISEGHAEGLRVLVEDDEVPEAAGYAACLTPRLQAAGFDVVEYTAPGTNPDRSNPGVKVLWAAAYGPRSVPCLFTCSVGQFDRQSILAWQCTNGEVGCVTDIPGIGKDDVSVDYGLSQVLAGKPKPPPPPPDPLHYGVLTPAELSVVLHYDGARKHPDRYAGFLRVLEGQLAGFGHEVWIAAHTAPPRPVSWGYRNRGTRFQVLFVRSLGKQVAR